MKIQIEKKSPPPIWLFLSIIFILLFVASLLFDFRFMLGIGGDDISKQDMARAARVMALEFTPEELDLMRDDVRDRAAAYRDLRKHVLDNGVFPAIHFNPLPAAPDTTVRRQILLPGDPALPEEIANNIEKNIENNPEDLAFAPVSVLARLIRDRRITSTRLTRMYIDRLKRFNPTLKCAITLTEDLALEQARRADEEIAAGKYRGPLHGIPYGIKDLFATRGIKTTWGAMPYKDQVIDTDATVVQRLEEAGAVLTAKLTTGALAWGDVWFGGTTKNPWNIEQGSSGSSAGPASATAAGLVAFAVGTETWGSIVSPSIRCGVTGLRPTYGRVSRYGAMALSWSMDKVGPICRNAEDCALVFNALYGPDGRDVTLVDRPFRWDPDLDIKSLRIGYVKDLFDADYRNKANDARSLDVLRSMGVELVPIKLPDFPVDKLGFILNAEAAAAFDPLTRGGRDDLLVRQVRYAWPNVFRHARLIPAVEYIKANRFRTLLVEEMARTLEHIDVYIAPAYGGNHLLLTNLTGHPAVLVPNGEPGKDEAPGITFMGNLFKEAEVLALARAYQQKVPPKVNPENMLKIKN